MLDLSQPPHLYGGPHVFSDVGGAAVSDPDDPEVAAVMKYVAPHFFQGPGEHDLLEPALAEYSLWNVLHLTLRHEPFEALIQHGLLQVTAERERGLPYFSQTGRRQKFLEPAQTEAAFSEPLESAPFLENHFSELLAATEGFSADCRDALRNRDLCYSSPKEAFRANLAELAPAVERDHPEIQTAVERSVANGRHAVWDGDFLQLSV